MRKFKMHGYGDNTRMELNVVKEHSCMCVVYVVCLWVCVVWVCGVVWCGCV